MTLSLESTIWDPPFLKFLFTKLRVLPKCIATCPICFPFFFPMWNHLHFKPQKFPAICSFNQNQSIVSTNDMGWIDSSLKQRLLTIIEKDSKGLFLRQRLFLWYPDWKVELSNVCTVWRLQLEVRLGRFNACFWVKMNYIKMWKRLMMLQLFCKLL